MNINTGNTYVSKASSSNGVSGLASGLDTEGIVEAMLANTQSKIDKQQGLQQQTLWKQEIYRSIIASINTFQSKYFSSSSSTNLMAQGFYNVMNAVSKASAFKVTATTSAAVGNTSIRVDRLASNTKVTSGAAVSGKLAGSIDAAALQDLVDSELAGERKVMFSVGGQNVEVDLTDVFVSGGAFTQTTDAQKSQAIAQKINDAFQGAGLTTVSASVTGGTLTITNTDTAHSVSVVASQSSELGLRAMGLTGNKSSVKSGEVLALSTPLNLKSEFSFNVSLDDATKTIGIDLSKVLAGGTTTVDMDKFKTEMKTELDRAFGSNQISLVSAPGSSDFELGVSLGRKVMVGGSSDAMNTLGTKNGQSNKIGLGGALKDLYFGNALQGSRFSFTINGESFSFDEGATMSEVISTINGSDAGVRVVYKPLEDKFVMEATNSGAGFDIQMSQEEGNLLSAMFGSGADGTLKSGASVASGVLKLSDGTEATAATTLAELGLGDLDGHSAATTTLGDLNALTGGKLRFEDGRIVLTGTGDNVSVGSAADMKTLFGAATVNLDSGTGLTAAVGVVGKNALVEIDGVLTERSSNSFTVNGLNIELKETTTVAETIEVTRGTDQIVDNIKSFIGDYNALIEELNGLIREDATYKTYAPLTSEQKKEMTDREIELWEEKAKSGLLRGDSTIESLLSSMRSILYSKPAGSEYAIYDLGIETSSDWRDNGKLVLSTDGEARLRQMIDSDPDAVMKLFADEEDGLAVQLNKAISAAANTSSGSPGALVQIAGLKNKATETNNDLYYRLKAIEDKIAILKNTYEKEKSRYWRQFNAMEEMISNMNTQSSWLSMQLSS